jgi:hypothetical protein
MLRVYAHLEGYWGTGTYQKVRLVARTCAARINKAVFGLDAALTETLEGLKEEPSDVVR